MSTKRFLKKSFPNLSNTPHKLTSEETTEYNCIAWAAGENDICWWPDGVYYWPPEIPCEPTIAAFIQAFALLGYEICDMQAYEPGYEKVALYALNGKPTHMARQLENGFWTSKLGPNVDIEHILAGIENGGGYGKVVKVLKRRRTTISHSSPLCAPKSLPDASDK